MAVTKNRKKSAQLQRQFIVYFVILTLLIMLAAAALIYFSQNALVDYVTLYAQKSSEIIYTSFQQAVDQISAQLSTLQHDEGFRNMVELESYSHLTIDGLDTFQNTLSSRVNLPIGAVISLSAQAAHYSSLFSNSQLEDLDAAIGNARGVQFLGIISPGDALIGNNYLVFGYNFYYNKEKQGSAYIALDIDQFASSLPISEQPGVSFYLTDANENAALFELFVPQQTSQKKYTPEEASQKQATLDKLMKASPKYVAQNATFSNINCTLHCVVDSSNILKPLRNMYALTILLFLLLIIISISGNAYINNYVIKPLGQFSLHLKQLNDDGILLSKSPHLLSRSGCSEIQDIEMNFTALLDSITDLSAQIQKKNDDIHQAELALKDIEIEQLRSQINPHFLYNTLELIRADALAGRINQVSAITAAMGRIYRYSIKGAPIVTLKEEIEHIKSYLIIQKERFNGKISCFYSISPEAEILHIPKMILQPLVENAIQHGLEPSASKGILFLGASIQDDHLLLSVRDNGVGIPEDRLQQLRDELQAPLVHRSCVGLLNVSERIRLQYGGQGRMLIESTTNDGTCILLELPLIF